MSYLQKDFVAHYEVATNAARVVHGDNSQTKAVDSDVAWNAYSHALAPQLGFHVFGRHLASKDLQPHRTGKHITGDLPPQLQGISRSPYDKFQANFGYVNDTEDGSILMMGGNKWNFTINDAWLLGGVHSHLPFYAASMLARINVYHTKYVLTITGRELLGLALYGYKQTSRHAALGHAFVCDDTKKADAASLVDYQAAVGETTTMQAAAQIFAQAGFTIV